MTGVPRVASFDDLRVGQCVALCNYVDGGKPVYAFAGQINAEPGTENAWCEPTEGRPFAISKSACERNEVTILRDAPEPPVTVRRADFDALAAALPPADADWYKTTAFGAAFIAAVSVLIDNADTGDTP